MATLQLRPPVCHQPVARSCVCTFHYWVTINISCWLLFLATYRWTSPNGPCYSWLGEWYENWCGIWCRVEAQMKVSVDLKFPKVLSLIITLFWSKCASLIALRTDTVSAEIFLIYFDRRTSREGFDQYANDWWVPEGFPSPRGLCVYQRRLHKVDQSIQLATFMFLSLFIRSQWYYPSLLEILKRSG